MRKLIITIMMALIVIGMLTGSAVAGSGDENWNGEDGDQPRTGAIGIGNTDNSNSANGSQDITRQRNWLL